MQESALDLLYVNLISLVEETRTPYIVIGGLAVGVIGEPRLTHDIDLIVFLAIENIQAFLEKSKKRGFIFNDKEVFKEIRSTGTFRLNYGLFHADFIIASTRLEKNALKRGQKIMLFGKKAVFPSPEDLILLKIIPGRERDLLDAKSIVKRHFDKLDKRYLEKWSMKLSDEAEDLRVYNQIKRLIRENDPNFKLIN